MIGIVASRLVERYHRPVVLIAAGEQEWKGSGRSIPAFDLHGGLNACSGLLERFGGHRAAAGLSIRPERIEEFAAAFAAACRRRALGDDDLRRVTRIDAVVPRNVPLTLGLCQELSAARALRARQPERHPARARVRARRSCGRGRGQAPSLPRPRPRPASTAARRSPSEWAAQLDRFRATGLYDVAFRLQENRWNGTVAPQLVVQRVFDTPDRYREVRAWLAEEFRKASGRDPLAEEIFPELRLEHGAPRSLLESERFREFLVDLPLPRAA